MDLAEKYKKFYGIVYFYLSKGISFKARIERMSTYFVGRVALSNEALQYLLDTSDQIRLINNGKFLSFNKDGMEFSMSKPTNYRVGVFSTRKGFKASDSYLYYTNIEIKDPNIIEEFFQPFE